MASESRSNVPASTSIWQRRSYSSADPSHQCDVVGLRQRGDLLDPGQQLLVASSGRWSDLTVRVTLLVCGCGTIGGDHASVRRRAGRHAVLYSTLALRAPARSPGVCACGTSTRRLNSATSDAVLVEDARVDLDGAAVGLGARLLVLEHLGLARTACRRGRPAPGA